MQIPLVSLACASETGQQVDAGRFVAEHASHFFVRRAKETARNALLRVRKRVARYGDIIYQSSCTESVGFTVGCHREISESGTPFET